VGLSEPLSRLCCSSAPPFCCLSTSNAVLLLFLSIDSGSCSSNSRFRWLFGDFWGDLILYWLLCLLRSSLCILDPDLGPSLLLISSSRRSYYKSKPFIGTTSMLSLPRLGVLFSYFGLPLLDILSIPSIIISGLFISSSALSFSKVTPFWLLMF